MYYIYHSPIVHPLSPTCVKVTIGSCASAGRGEFKPTELAYPTAQKGVCLGLLRVWVGYLSDLCSVVKETETVYLAVAPCPCGQPSLCVLYMFVCKWRRSKVVVVSQHLFTYMCSCMYVHLCLYTCACVHACVFVCVRACLCACMRVSRYMSHPKRLLHVCLVCPALPPATFSDGACREVSLSKST